MQGKYRILGFTGAKTFQGEKGDTIRYAKATLRSTEGQVCEVKANPDCDLSKFLDKEVTATFTLLKTGVVRLESVV